MSEDQVRQIVREELNTTRNDIERALEFFKKTNFNFQKHLTILDDKNIQVGRTNGTMIGTATDQKIGFLGKTPVIQQSTISDPSGATADTDNEARTAIISIIDVLQAFGFIA